MGGYIFLSFISAIVALFIAWLISSEFQSIAEQKGHNDRKYFWFCFFFGIVGYLMVIALPDRYKKSEQPAAPAPTPPKSTIPSGDTAEAWVGTYSIKCERCNNWQSKANTVCSYCGATFTRFIEQ